MDSHERARLEREALRRGISPKSSSGSAGAPCSGPVDLTVERNVAAPEANPRPCHHGGFSKGDRRKVAPLLT